MDPTWRLRHVSALDGLRGLAVLGVIAFHAGQTTGVKLTGGYLGADLFFVLSGFLITSLLLGERRDTHRIHLGRFWERRARRLLPALLVVLVVVGCYAFFLAAADEEGKLRADGLTTLFYVANWRGIFAHDSYWTMFESPSPLQHTWSLAIEEQFYLLWPLVLFGLIVWKQRSAKAVLAVSLVGAAISVLLMQVLYEPGDTTRAYFGTDTRIGAMLLGAALAASLAQWGHVREPRHRRALEIGAVVAAVVLALCWATVDGQSTFLYRGGFLLCELAGLVLIACVTHPEAGPVGRGLSIAPLVWVGLVSYGLYLWHWPVFVIADSSRLHISGFPLLAVQLVITFALAATSFYLLERPIRRGALPTRQAVIAAPVAMSAVALLIVGTTVARRGAVTSDDMLASVAVPSAAAGGGPGEAAAARDPKVPVRQAAHDVLGRAPRVLFAGDSVSFTLAAGVVPYQHQLGVDVRSEAVIACGIARGDGRMKLADGTILTENDYCHDWTTHWAGAITEFHPDVALLVIGWPGHTSRFVDGDWRQPCDPAFDRWYEGELRDALHVLHEQGTRGAMATAPYYRSPKAPEGTDAKTDCLNALYRRVAADTGTAVIELAPYVCPNGNCRIEENGVPVRPDGLHFDGTSGTLVGAWLLDRALEPLLDQRATAPTSASPGGESGTPATGGAAAPAPQQQGPSLPSGAVAKAPHPNCEAGVFQLPNYTAGVALLR